MKPDSLPGIVRLLRSDLRNRPDAAAAGTPLPSLPPLDWLRLDAALRRWDEELPLQPRGMAEAASCVAGLREHPAEWALPCIASMQPSGWLREAALARMRELRDPRCLPAVVLRLSDWVPRVQHLACDVFAAHAGPGSGGALARAWPILCALGSGERRPCPQDVLESARRLLLSEPSDLIDAAVNGTGEVRRRALELVATLRGADAVQALRLGLASADLPCRRAIAGQLDAIRDEDARFDIASLAARDADPRVRSRAWTALERIGRPVEAGTLLRGIFDSVTITRWIAQDMARRAGIDPATECLRELRARPPARGLGGVIKSAGDLKLPAAIPCLVRLAREGRASHRALALRVLADLDPEQAAPVALEMLRDSSSVAVRAAVIVAARHGIELPREILLGIVARDDGRERVKRAILAQAATLPKWDGLELLLAGLASPASAAAADALPAWLARVNRSSVLPDASQLARLELALGRAARAGVSWPRADIESLVAVARERASGR